MKNTKNQSIAYVDVMSIEVTRRCNMACEHCLRGCAQNMDADPRNLLHVARYIKPASIVFTGGEPSLNVKVIDTYLRYALNYGNFPLSFFIATNGKDLANQTKLAELIMRWYPFFEYKEMCQVDISRDMFHEPCDIGYNPITSLKCYYEDGHTHDNNSYDWVINEGRAENTWGCRPSVRLATDLDEIVDSIYNGQVHIDELYLSSSGYLVSDCDASYERIDSEHICHVRDFRKLVQQYMRRAA